MLRFDCLHSAARQTEGVRRNRQVERRGSSTDLATHSTMAYLGLLPVLTHALDFSRARFRLYREWRPKVNIKTVLDSATQATAIRHGEGIRRLPSRRDLSLTY